MLFIICRYVKQLSLVGWSCWLLSCEDTEDTERILYVLHVFHINVVIGLVSNSQKLVPGRLRSLQLRQPGRAILDWENLTAPCILRVHLVNKPKLQLEEHSVGQE
jgi:hypothetical protein